jgi:hypothetical protein
MLEKSGPIATNLFPTYGPWVRFIEDHGQPIIKDCWNPEYKNPNGIVNRLEFANFHEGKSAYQILQKYENKNLGLRVETILQRRLLRTELQLSSPTAHLDNILVLSESLLTDNDRWDRTQEILMRLSDEYLDRLETDGTISDTSMNTLSVKYKGSFERTIERMGIWGSEPLSQEVLERICHDAGFNFSIIPYNKVTKATLGTLRFSIKHTDSSSIYPEKIWDVITGKKHVYHKRANPFIFPVNVYKRKERVI